MAKSLQTFSTKEIRSPLAWADLHSLERTADPEPTARGNTEGTPPRAPASTHGHPFSDASFFLRGFRARGFPRVPAPPSSALDGKEGVDGSSPSEGLYKVPANWHFTVAWQKNTRTHFGHIGGTRDAPRRFATPSDTAFRARSERADQQNPAKRPRLVSEQAGERPPLPKEGVIGIPSVALHRHRPHAGGRRFESPRSHLRPWICRSEGGTCTRAPL
jgi:hypothetical protein